VGCRRGAGGRGPCHEVARLADPGGAARSRLPTLLVRRLQRLWNSPKVATGPIDTASRPSNIQATQPRKRSAVETQGGARRTDVERWAGRNLNFKQYTVPPGFGAQTALLRKVGDAIYAVVLRNDKWSRSSESLST